MGFCPQCREGGLLAEESGATAGPAPIALVDVDGTGTVRRSAGIGEVDRVLGGGLVPGATILLGGEPGVGKSTLLLQIAAAAQADGVTLLASAEESAGQVALRAGRIGADASGVHLVAERDVDAVIAAAATLRPELLIVDSIQSVAASNVDGSAGGVAQVRECAARLIRFAKESGVVLVMIGHVTKDGSIAGPKHLEHMVDVVLYLEGESDRGLRVLRGLKNRYGPVSQVGLFTMNDDGMLPVIDPSDAIAGGWSGAVPGTVAFPAIEGRRPLLVEVQALVGPARAVQPRRSVKGLDAARMHQVLAVLERHAGLRFSDREVYVSIIGGVRVREPAVDLPVAVALVSSLLDLPAGRIAAWGEVGLTGEVRTVAGEARRREEAMRFGIGVMAPGPGIGRVTDALAATGLVLAPAAVRLV
jgi:DNA repair protein RadA/Sms